MVKIYNTGPNEICEFTNRITPKNWKVLLDDKIIIERYEHGFKRMPLDSPATLYIRLFIQENNCCHDPYRLGESHGPMRFFNGFATSELCLYPHTPKIYEDTLITWEGTIIHELAHIAVNRWLALKKKAFKTDGAYINSTADLDENAHGPTFQKALLTILDRACAVYGNKIEKAIYETDMDLDYYESISGDF